MKQVRTSLFAFLFALIALAITVFVLQPVPSQAAPPQQLSDDCMVITTTIGIPGSVEHCMSTIQSGHTVTFSSTVFPPDNPVSLYPESPLPIIDQTKNGLTIDGTGAGVILDGSQSMVTDSIGLLLEGVTGVTVKGLQIQNFPGGGVVLRNGAYSNTIGGVNATPGNGCSGDCNLISGNGGNGVNISGAGSISNTVSGNFIGTNATGTDAISNTQCGVWMGEGASYNTIGGDTAGEGNLISGNGDSGVNISGAGSISNTVSGNYIGTNITGTAVLSNNGNGITIDENATGNTVGGNTPGEANLIGGNNANGVAINGGAAHNTVSGNAIGVDLAGTTVISNGIGSLGSGVALSGGAQHNIISGNTIGGNNPGGVALFDDETAYNIVSGNIIGLENAGNAQAGVFLVYGAQNNLIGGQSITQSNVIAHNGETGIYVMGANTISNTLSHNSIYNNGAISDTNTGIALVDGGNTELFPPILTDVAPNSVSGMAPPNSTVEIYSDAGDEGRYFHGSTTAGASGAFSFSQTEPFTGANVTATATDSGGNTSQFSVGYAPTVDAQVLAVFNPKTTAKAGQMITPTVKVGNAGTTIEVVTVTAETDAGYADSVSGVQLPALGYTTLSFTPFTPGLAETMVHFTATVELPGDQEANNNTQAVTISVGSDQIDLWTRDGETDSGDIPTRNFWQSPDIWVRNTCDGGTEHQSPIAGQENCVYLTVRNRGNAATSGVDTANVYWHDSSLGIKCGDWASVSEGQTIPALAANTGETTLAFTWTPSRTGHTCLHGEIISADDPIAHACDIAWDNNLSQRNVDIIAGSQALVRLMAAGGINFEVTNIKDKPKPVSLIIDVSTVSDANAVQLDLGSDLINRWLSVDGPDQSSGISWNGGNVITVTNATSGTITGIPFSGGETQTVTLRVDAPSMDTASVTVYEAIDGGSGGVSLIDSIVGGNTYLFNTETVSVYLPLIIK